MTLSAEFFTLTGQTWVVALDPPQLDGLHLELCERRPGAVVRRLRGERCPDEPAFFDEAAAALQFPAYFGHNWNAFEETLSQYWLPADAIVILIANAHQLFSRSPAALVTLSRIIAQGLSPIAAPGHPPIPRPLTLVHQTPGPELAPFTRRLAAAAIRFQAI